MLEMHVPLLIATALIFLFLLVVLNKILYKPLLGFMDSRNNLIKEDLEKISKNADDASVYYDEANKIMLEAKNKASAERLELLTKAKAEQEKKINEKKNKLESEYSEFLKALEVEKNDLRNALVSQLPLYKEAVKAKLSKI